MPAAGRFFALALFAALSWLPASHAQAPAAAPAAAQPPPFKPEEIEQFVAPIALYPDPLVAQILMASTYPLEVVSAARWQKSNASLKGKQLEDALEKQTWDPSVKSLTSFPQVLEMMDKNLDMTQKLGDAFLADQKGVMSAIQRLRAKADQTGNLKSGKELTVGKTQEGGTTYITIEPANPQVVYVPTYNPAVVYGTWPYPAYPPYAYYPPGYVPGAAFWGFAAGIAIGAAWHNNGNCNWGSGDININNSNNTNINRGQGGQGGNRPQGGQGGGKWEHRPEHRQGAGYRDQASRDRFGGGQQRAGVDSREQFRGRAEQGRQEISRGGASDRMAGSGNRQGGDLGGRGASQQPAGGFGGGDRGGAGNRPSQQLPGGGGDRGSLGGGDRGGFGGVGGGGAQTRDFSNRGASSRQNSSFGGGGGGGGRAQAGGGGRGGGGGGRGGGGGGRGGGGRR